MQSTNNLLSGVVQQLRRTKWSQLPQLAQAAGVPESTIKKIRSGEVKDPRFSTVQALDGYFRRQEKTKEANHA